MPEGMTERGKSALARREDERRSGGFGVVGCFQKVVVLVWDLICRLFRWFVSWLRGEESRPGQGNYVRKDAVAPDEPADLEESTARAAPSGPVEAAPTETAGLPQEPAARNRPGRSAHLPDRPPMHRTLPPTAPPTREGEWALAEKIIVHKGAGSPARGRAKRGPGVPEGGFYLHPYHEWTLSWAGVLEDDSVSSLAHIVQRIVDVEGPVVLERANAICTSIAGRSHSQESAARLCEDAISQAEREGRICRLRFQLQGDRTQTVLCRPGASGVLPRERGPREGLDEIPLPELGAHMRRMRDLMTGRGKYSLLVGGHTEDEFLRRVLQTYGVQRLTPRARSYLDAAQRVNLETDACSCVGTGASGAAVGSTRGRSQERFAGGEP